MAERKHQLVADWPISNALNCRMPLVVAALGLMVLAGCGPRSDRLEISGNVTLDGAPLDGGSIRFTSLGEKIIASGALIQQGEYHIKQEKGLTVGTYHVEITAPDVNAQPVMVPVGGGRSMPVQPERIPPEYNVKSKQTIEVSLDGDNHFVFDIVTRPSK
jgi:hypothetical protein